MLNNTTRKYYTASSFDLIWMVIFKSLKDPQIPTARITFTAQLTLLKFVPAAVSAVQVFAKEDVCGELDLMQH